MIWWNQIRHLVSTIGILDVVDVIIVAIVIYQIYRMIKNTRALALATGIFVLLIATLVSRWLNLHVIYWLLQKTITVLLVALPIVFQPELRRALEKLGRVPLIAGSDNLRNEEMKKVIRELVTAAEILSRDRTGALMVLEQKIGLSDYIETGIEIDGKVSEEILINIFIPNTPLHDGAVIIRGDRIMAAGCLLPLTEDDRLSKELGTRHRAGIGMSEQSDAIVLIVSEETGKISISYAGTLTRVGNSRELAYKLEQFLLLPQEKVVQRFKNFFNSKGGGNREG